MLGAALASGVASLDDRAGAEPLHQGFLPSPDFTRLRKIDPYVVGVRPHRRGGVRLAVEPLGDSKRLVHHYGHGGAGITLAFGTAPAAADLVRSSSDGTPRSIAVVGTGVIGLATARELRRRYPEAVLTVYAAELDLRRTTSWVAGGQFEPSGIWREYTEPDAKSLLSGWIARARGQIVALRQRGLGDAYGIAPRDNYTLDHDLAGDLEPTGRRRGTLPFPGLSGRVGRVFPTYLLNPTLLLPRLRDDLVASGVRFVRRRFADRRALAALPEPIVVNCAGYGARQLVADDDVTPQLGHLVALERTDEAQNYFVSGGCLNAVVFYVFCRHDDIVVGGSVVEGRDDTSLLPGDPAVFDRIVANGRAFFGGRPDACR